MQLLTNKNQQQDCGRHSLPRPLVRSRDPDPLFSSCSFHKRSWKHTLERQRGGRMTTSQPSRRDGAQATQPLAQPCMEGWRTSIQTQGMKLSARCLSAEVLKNAKPCVPATWILTTEGVSPSLLSPYSSSMESALNEVTDFKSTPSNGCSRPTLQSSPDDSIPLWCVYGLERSQLQGHRWAPGLTPWLISEELVCRHHSLEIPELPVAGDHGSV